MTLRLAADEIPPPPINAEADDDALPKALIKRDSVSVVMLGTGMRLHSSRLRCKSVAYSQCVAVHVEDIQKDICSKEFRAFKDCVQQAVLHRCDCS
jgi:hypothetical protein